MISSPSPDTWNVTAVANNANGTDSQIWECIANKADQVITFGSLADKTYGDPDLTVSATASSGLPVSFAAAGTCTVSGTSVHITTGICTMTAQQAGNASYNAATDVSQSFNINKAAADVTGTLVINKPTSTTSSSKASDSGCGRNVNTKEDPSNFKQHEFSREVDVYISDSSTVFNFVTLGIVNEVGFTARTNEGCITALGELLKNRPSQSTSDVPYPVIAYFNAWVGPMGYSESSKIEYPYVVFKVSEDSKPVQLMMYKNGAWIELKTEKIGEGTYKAYTQGFGSFAIVEIPETLSITPVVTTPQAVTNDPVSQNPVNLHLFRMQMRIAPSGAPLKPAIVPAMRQTTRARLTRRKT